MVSDALQKARDYEERLGAFIEDAQRPVFHYSARVGWLNDPNGFSLYKGEYHLFHQYHPYSNQWGPMHWGHAVSKDLLHWEYLPAALAPDQGYDRSGCFSGSAIALEDGRQLLLYTGVREEAKEDGTKRSCQTQCIAVGDGVNYEKYAQNPVIDGRDVPQGFSKSDFRDPKLFRNPDGSFGCVVGCRTEDESGAILYYRSEDGFSWRYRGILDRSYNEYGRMWECPDLFPLDGEDILLTSPQDMSPVGLEFHNGNGTLCLIGDWDEEKAAFTRRRVQAVDYGIDFYAPQTLLTEDGRRIMIAWMQNWDTCTSYPSEAKWFGQMTLPRELRLRDGRLLQNPVRELEALHGRRIAYESVPVSAETVLQGIYGRVIDMTVRVRPQSPGSYELFRLKFARGSHHFSSLSYRPGSSMLHISRKMSGFNRDFVHDRRCLVRDRGGEIKLRLVLDRFSVEVFVNDGEQALTMTFYTPLTADGISFEAHGNALLDVEKYEIIG